MNRNFKVNALTLALAVSGRISASSPNTSNTPKSITYTKIPEATLNRPAWKQTVAVEIAHKVPCAKCGAPAGYYCSSPSGNRLHNYHQIRFEAFMRTSKHHPTTSRGHKREELKGH